MKMRKKSGLITQRIRLEKLNHIILVTLVALILALTWTAIQAQAQGPDFGQSYKTGPAHARPGDLITYTIVAVNDGDSITDGVTLSDTLPAGWVSYAPGSCTYYTETRGAALPCALTDTSPIWTAPFTAGQRITTTFAVTVTAGEGSLRLPFVNRAYLAWEGGRQEVVFTTTLLSAIPDFTGSYKTLTQSEEHQEIVKGDTLTYSIVALNSGDPVTDVILADPTPPGLDFARCTYTYEDGASVNDCEVPTPPTYTLWVNDLTVGNRITTTITYTATAGTLRWPITNCARLQWGPIEEPLCADRVLVNPKAYIYLPLVLRNYPPVPEGSVTIADGDATVYQSEVTLSLEASFPTGVDEVSEMRFSNDNVNWPEDWDVYTDTDRTHTLASGISGPRTVYAQFRGKKGGSLITFDQTYLVWNGDFESGLNHWQAGQGPFRGNGSGLSQSISSFEGSNRLLLGNPASQDNAIPVGYAYVTQEFMVPAGNSRMSFDYRVISRDHVQGATTGRYFDTFELSINQPPEEISNNDRDNQGCYIPDKLNPVGTLTPDVDGLVFCGGQPPTTPPNAWDSGWRTVTLDLQHFAGQNQKITLYIALWSREYDHPYYNDKGYYNTYAYVDNIQWGE